MWGRAPPNKDILVDNDDDDRENDDGEIPAWSHASVEGGCLPAWGTEPLLTTSPHDKGKLNHAGN